MVGFAITCSAYASSTNSGGAIQFIPAPTEATSPTDPLPTHATNPTSSPGRDNIDKGVVERDTDRPNSGSNTGRDRIDTIGNISGVPSLSEISILNGEVPLDTAMMLGSLPKTGGNSLPAGLLLCLGLCCIVGQLMFSRRAGADRA